MSKYRQEAERLLDTGTEEELLQILQEPFYSDENWRPLGQQDNNFGIVENQAASPLAALAEIVVNSIDAILLKNYNEKTKISDDIPEFHTMHEAVDELVNQNEEDVTIAADGEKGGPISLQIEDTGEGKSPDRFEETFLGLLQPGSLKQEYEFLQGQYGMGSSGVLPFCGTQGYKLIVSSSFTEKERWSWSLIRKNEQKTRYEYFTVDGDIPTFEGSLKGQSYGSFVKLYNYQIDQKSNLASDRNLRRFLERYLVDSPLEITLDERRDYQSFILQDATSGGLDHIKNRHSNLIESNHHLEYSFENPNLGTRNIEVVLFKEDAELSDKEQQDKRLFIGGQKHRRQAIFFLVNGQTHGDQGKSFIKNRCSRSRVADDTLIFVDFSDITGTDLVNLFKPSRDRLTDKSIADDLKEGLASAIQGDEVLKTEERLRRERAVEDQDEQFSEFVEEILDSNSYLRNYFSGDDIGTAVDDEGAQPTEAIDLSEINFDPPHIPDEFVPISTFRSRIDFDKLTKEDGIYEIEVPHNSSKRVRFYLNAPDNYFDRENATGGLRITPREAFESRQLSKGILSIVLRPLPGSRAGTEIPVTIEVERPSGDPLSSTIRLVCTDEEEDETEDTSGEELALQLPNITEVYEADWDEHDFSEDDVVRIDDYTSEGGGLDIFINMDCDQLSDSLSSLSLDSPEKSEAKLAFKRGITVFSVSQYVELRRSRRSEAESEGESERDEDDDTAPDIISEDLSPADVVEQSMRGISRTIIDQYFATK
jgi:hypothetical protein